MRKKCMIGLVLILGLLSGCSTNKEIGEQKEKIDNPEITTSADANEQRENEEEAIFELTDASSSYFVRIPLFQNKISGVYDLNDYFKWYTDNKADEWGKIDSYNAKLNCPDGASGTAASFTNMFVSPQRYFIKSEDGSEVLLNDSRWPAAYELQKVRLAWSEYYTDDKKKVVDKSDIQVFSFALYEELGEIPGITLSLYGMDEQDYEKGMETKNEETYFHAAKLYSEYENGTDCLTKLGSFPISESGIKYVDYRELTQGVDYVNILVVLEFDKQVDNYSFFIDGSYAYNVTDGQAYDAWKMKHKEAMLH